METNWNTEIDFTHDSSSDRISNLGDAEVPQTSCSSLSLRRSKPYLKGPSKFPPQFRFTDPFRLETIIKIKLFLHK